MQIHLCRLFNACYLLWGLVPMFAPFCTALLLLFTDRRSLTQSQGTKGVATPLSNLKLASEEFSEVHLNG